MWQGPIMARSWPKVATTSPHMDLVTVRATLAYMADDMRHAAGCDRIARALDTAISEIDGVADGRRDTGEPRVGLTRFLPWNQRD